MADASIQIVSDENGQPTGVIVPIDLWREIESERETSYLLKSQNMRTRLLDALHRDDGLGLEDVIAKLGVWPLRVRGSGVVG